MPLGVEGVGDLLPRRAALAQVRGPLWGGPLIEAITLWNTVYLQELVRQLADQHVLIPARCLPRLAPLVWDHILLTGEYRWRLAGSN